MTCEPLAYTGGGQLGVLLTLAIGCLLAGTVLVLLSRRRGRAATVVLLLVGGGSVMLAVGVPTPAVADDCPPVADHWTDTLPADNDLADNSVTIIQTSVMAGMAPGVAPVAITGIVSNNGPDSTSIAAIDTEITAVIVDPDAAPGLCDHSDYVLLNARMPVDQTLDLGESVAFEGASIGFSNKSTNQDACKGATVKLLYTAIPS